MCCFTLLILPSSKNGTNLSASNHVQLSHSCCFGQTGTYFLSFIRIKFFKTARFCGGHLGEQVSLCDLGPAFGDLKAGNGLYDDKI